MDSVSMVVIDQLRQDLAILKEQCEEEEQRKSVAQLAKLEADDLKQEAQEQLDGLMEELSKTGETMTKEKNDFSRAMQDLLKEEDELMRNLRELESKVKECTKTNEKIRNELQVENILPNKNINCTALESGPGNMSDISSTCQIVIQQPLVLQGRRALITFEDEEVAQGIIDKGRHKVELNGVFEDLRAYKVEPGRTVKFEVNLTMSSKKVKVSDLPNDLSEDILKDKLELAFYKSDIGGGEVESVDYNGNYNSACITYKENGVAQRVLKKNQHDIKVGNATYKVVISPVIQEQLNKLQMFSGICHRTVLLSEIKNQTDSEDDIKDLVEIHFQKESNGGGEVECIAFSLEPKLAHFEAA